MSKNQRFRLSPASLALVCAFASVSAAAEKRVLFIHTNKSSASGVILFDKTFQSGLTETQGERITLYNEYTDLWHFDGDDYLRTLKDFYQKKYALIIVPSLVGRLLLGEELTGIAVPVARVAGIALIGLGVACWPGPARVGMLTYLVHGNFKRCCVRCDSFLI